MSGEFEFWANSDFRLIKEEDPDNPEWCVVSRPFIEWGDRLIDRLKQDPLPLKVGFAKWKLLDNYARRHYKTTPDHRPESNQGRHHCLHEALLAIWQKMEDVELHAAIPELQPPRLMLSPLHPVIDADVEEDPPIEEVSGIIIGHQEDEAEDRDEDDEDT